jgi:hypothetical protein
MSSETIVTAGVDTHTDVHVTAVLDQAGRLLGTRAFPATTRGYAQLATWTESFGQIDKVGTSIRAKRSSVPRPKAGHRGAFCHARK